MTTSPYEQAPEALRLADDLEASSLFPGNRRSCNNAGAAELRRMHAENEALHAENEALRAGYNAARLEIESLKTQIIPGVQWQCGPLVSGFTAPQPATNSPADSVTTPAGERENLALRRMLCVAHAGAAAYMDDGEAQDSRELPIIDFLRDTPDEIQDKLQRRALKKLAMTQATDNLLEDAARHFFDAGWKACANFCDRDDVRFDGIVGHCGCPQFEEAFRVARKQGGV